MSVLAASPIISPSQGALSAAAYMRIASISIAAYEYVASGCLATFHRDSFAASYLLTLPSEYRLYKSSDRRG
jgi:hypothetical protein